MGDHTQYVGIGAGMLTALSMLPQLIKIVKEKKADSISYGMLSVLLAGISGWIWYGILKNDYPIIITNIISLILNLLVTGLSIKYKEKRSGSSE